MIALVIALELFGPERINVFRANALLQAWFDVLGREAPDVRPFLYGAR